MTLRFAQVRDTNLLFEFVTHLGTVNLCRLGTTETFTMSIEEFGAFVEQANRIRGRASIAAAGRDWFERTSMEPATVPPPRFDAAGLPR